MSPERETGLRCEIDNTFDDGVLILVVCESTLYGDATKWLPWYTTSCRCDCVISSGLGEKARPYTACTLSDTELLADTVVFKRTV